MPDDDYTIPLGDADIKREGSDVTVVAARLARARGAGRGRGACQGGDLGRGRRSAHARAAGHADDPASVQKTGRLVIADEAGPTAGFSAEVAAVVTEDAATFARLKAPGEAGLCAAGADPLQPRARKSCVPGPQAHHRRHPRGARGKGGLTCRTPGETAVSRRLWPMPGSGMRPHGPRAPASISAHVPSCPAAIRARCCSTRRFRQRWRGARAASSRTWTGTATSTSAASTRQACSATPSRASRPPCTPPSIGASISRPSGSGKASSPRCCARAFPPSSACASPTAAPRPT